MRVENYRDNFSSVGGSHFVYHHVNLIEEPNGSSAEFSEQYCEACHHKDLRPAQQADLGQFMWSIETHLLLYWHYYGELVSLSSGITGDSSVNCYNAKEVGQ